jgi:hypothetical protein
MDEDNNIGFEDSFKDVERTGMRGIDIDVYLNEFSLKQTKLFRSDIESFIINTNSIAREMVDNNILNNNDLENILENIKNLDKPNLKNPSAYILGYIASNGGRNLDIENYKKALNIIKRKKTKYSLEDTSVLQPDIVRYARIWINF